MTSKDERERARRAADERHGAPPSSDVVLDDVGEASAESFPASDPPSSTGMRAGPPDRAIADDGAP
jgi:hypothetical protein